MTINDWNAVTICPLAYTNIEAHYCKWWGFITNWQWVDNLWNQLQWWSVRLYNDDPTDVQAPVIWWYEFDHWEFTDANGVRQCISDNPISLLTCRTV